MSSLTQLVCKLATCGHTPDRMNLVPVLLTWHDNLYNRHPRHPSLPPKSHTSIDVTEMRRDTSRNHAQQIKASWAPRTLKLSFNINCWHNCTRRGRRASCSCMSTHCLLINDLVCFHQCYTTCSVYWTVGNSRSCSPSYLMTHHMCLLQWSCPKGQGRAATFTVGVGAGHRGE
jgi:hypothetical protein